MLRLVLAAAIAVCIHGGRGTQDPVVRHAVRAMLGLGTPPRGEGRAGRLRGTNVHPAYMMELYQRYTNNGTANGTDANTVRSIQADVG